MFVPRDKWNPKELRQGDVIAGIAFPFVQQIALPILASLECKNYQSFPVVSATLHPHREPDDATYFTAQITAKISLCAVTTHCCELEVNSKGIPRANALALCRLIPLTKTMRENEEKLRNIRANKDPRRQDEPGYMDYFYYGQLGDIGNVELMADFNQTTSIAKTECPAILENKVRQLDDRTRMKFKIKLGTFNARSTKEEEASGIYQDPWMESEGP